MASYNAAIVDDYSIIVDAELDAGYTTGTKITSYQDEEPYKRSDWNAYPWIQELADADFFAYIAVDTEGMYIYAEIEDATIFDEDRDGNANEGDYIQIYLDWCEPNADPMLNMKHPSPEEMYEQYLLEGTKWENTFDYRSM